MTNFYSAMRIILLLFISILLSACNDGGGSPDDVSSPDDGGVESEIEKVFSINIDSPTPGEVVNIIPVHVIGEVRSERPIRQVVVNGAEQDVSGQVFVPGDGDTIPDQYVLSIEGLINITDMAQEIAGLVIDEGAFDPGSNRLVVSAVDDHSNQVFNTRMFAVGEVTPPERPVDILSKPVGNERPSIYNKAFTNEVDNALTLGVSAADLNNGIKDFCEDITPLISDLIKENAKVKPYIGSYTLPLSYENVTACDPTVTFGINTENIIVDTLSCSVTVEQGLLTLNVKPQIRELEVTARGECGICVDLGDQTLESVAVGANLAVGIDMPTIIVSLTDWQNNAPISPDDVALDRFFTDSLTTPAIEKARVIEATVKDSIPSPFASILHQTLVSSVEGSGFGEEIGYVLDPSTVVVSEARAWLSGQIVGYLKPYATNHLESKVCQGGVNDTGDVDCTDDSSKCTNEGSSCEYKYDQDVLNTVKEQFGLDSFQTDINGITLSAKGKFSPALIDPEVTLTPGALRTPAGLPLIGDAGAESSFFVIADDAFNQLFASLTEMGNIKHQCLPPVGDAPSTLGDFNDACTNPVSGSDEGTGVCVAMTGGNCEALSLATDQGVCHGARGDNCSTIPTNPLNLPTGNVLDPEKDACNDTPDMNLSAEMPVLYCPQSDVAPTLWIKDDIATDSQVESYVRLNDLLVGIVIDRRTEGFSGDISILQDCASPNAANQQGACLLGANCLDINLSSNITLTTDSSGSILSANISDLVNNGFKGFDCKGSTSTGPSNPLGVTPDNVINQLITEINSELEKNPFGYPDGLSLPLVDPRLVVIKTNGTYAEFDDYIGIASQGQGTANLCGNNICDSEERCGYGAGGCAKDCGLCEAGSICETGNDCNTGLCVGNLCVAGATAELNSLSCNGECLDGRNCQGGVCNFGFCTTARSLPALSPCSTGEACQNGSCSLGFCEEICGDGFCDGTEQRGATDNGLACNTDCGKVLNGDACAFDESCDSGVCNFAICIAPHSQSDGSVCDADVACSSNSCVAGICTTNCGNGVCDEPYERCGATNNPVTLSCTSDCGKCDIGDACLFNETCTSNVCNGTTCIAANSVLVGGLCDSNNACRSGNCTLGLCASRCGDGYCDGLEERGATDSGLVCNTDCGKKDNGETCLFDDSCESGNCSLLTCEPAPPACLPIGNGCVFDSSCCSGACTFVSLLEGKECE